MLVAAFLMVALGPFQLLAGAEVFEGAGIDAEECQKDPDEVCAQLTFFNETGTRIGSVQGTGEFYGPGFKRKWWNKAGDVKVQQTGTGCYRIFMGRGQKGGHQTLKDQNKKNATFKRMM
jgi:hypothetical protein